LEAAPVDGLQTPSGLATPSGMASVVSTVAAGLETPDFLELRKTSTTAVRDEGGNRQLYSVLQEKQTSVRGLMGSERGYDVSGVVGASVPVLGDERGTKVGVYDTNALPVDPKSFWSSARQVVWMFHLM
jgi:splicing factor 3B subunit 2